MFIFRSFFLQGKLIMPCVGVENSFFFINFPPLQAFTIVDVVHTSPEISRKNQFQSLFLSKNFNRLLIYIHNRRTEDY